MKKILAVSLLSIGAFAYAVQDEDKILQQQMTMLRQPIFSVSASKVAQAPKKKPNSQQVAMQQVQLPQPSPAVSDVPPITALVKKSKKTSFETSSVSVHTVIDVEHPESVDFYPTALVAGDHVLTYIAGTPVISAPYLGSRPAFDGSDYIVNISSINRDVRLMQQRRSLERAYEKVGYPLPDRPILALSGAVVPFGSVGQLYFGNTDADWNLGSNELDLAAVLNKNVEAYMALAYNAAPPARGGPRVTNSALALNMGFVNIGDLDRTPWYVTMGQLYVPFGRFSTSMISATLPMMLTRIKSRPVILGYKSQKDTGVFAAIYGYHGDTTLGGAGVGGANLGYILDLKQATAEIGASFVSSINDSSGFQTSGGTPGVTFGGFGSFSNGSENVHKIPAVGVHMSTGFDRYSLTAEWVTVTQPFNVNDLSFDGNGAFPQAFQLEGGVTFESFHRPSSVGVSWQWSKQALAVNLPLQRFNAVYNISIWKDTVESLEYRHDIDYSSISYANGAAPMGTTNQNTVGTGGAADTLSLQVAVYF